MTKKEGDHKHIESFWNDFLRETPKHNKKVIPPSFYFCDNEKDANDCAELVVKRIKRATATSLWWFEKNNEPMPEIGDHSIVTDWNGNAKAIIETVKIELIPFNKITSDFAEIEGEGDKTLAYWKKVHQAYYTKEMKPFKEAFNDNMTIVCEHFKTIYCK